MTLVAANDLLLRSQQQVSEQVEKSKSSSGEIGVTVGSEAGIGVYVAASASKGKGQGSGLTHAETTVKAGNRLTLISGNDTTLEGAQVKGNQVLANIGGDLNIISQQDTNDYKRKDQSAGIDVAVGTGGGTVSANYNQQKIDSTYTSVKEQSGIQAGSGGFDITVGGHTQLTGGAIASTADPSRNRFSTGSLSVTDLVNEAEYSASSVGASFSGGSSGGGKFGGGVSPNVPMSQSDSASSVTRSGISEGTLEIRNGDTSVLEGLDRGLTELQQDGLKEIFNEREVMERMELGQVAGEVGFRAAGDIAGAMGRRANEELEQAQKSGDPAAIAAAKNKVDTWAEGGTGRTVLHGVTAAGMAALGGGDVAGGVLGAVGNQLAFNAMRDYLVNELEIPEGSDQFNTLIQMGSLAVGAAVGGSTGGSVALSATQNNYLTHAQLEAYEKELAACGGSGDPEACRQQVHANAVNLSAFQDWQLAINCNDSPTGSGCNQGLQDALLYRDKYQGQAEHLGLGEDWGRSRGSTNAVLGDLLKNPLVNGGMSWGEGWDRLGDQASQSFIDGAIGFGQLVQGVFDFITQGRQEGTAEGLQAAVIQQGQARVAGLISMNDPLKMADSSYTPISDDPFAVGKPGYWDAKSFVIAGTIAADMYLGWKMVGVPEALPGKNPPTATAVGKGAGGAVDDLADTPGGSTVSRNPLDFEPEQIRGDGMIAHPAKPPEIPAIYGDSASKIRHTFDDPLHDLQSLVDSYGSKDSAFSAVHSAAQAFKGRVGVTEGWISVGGNPVWVRGITVNGEFRIGTFSANKNHQKYPYKP